MTDKLIATYRREDTYNGYSRINHYHHTVEIRCYICDNSAERAMGIMVNGEPCKDYYDIVEVNYKGKVIYRHHHTDRDRANQCFMNLMKNIGGFRKV